MIKSGISQLLVLSFITDKLCIKKKIQNDKKIIGKDHTYDSYVHDKNKDDPQIQQVQYILSVTKNYNII